MSAPAREAERSQPAANKARLGRQAITRRRVAAQQHVDESEDHNRTSRETEAQWYERPGRGGDQQFVCPSSSSMSLPT